MRSDRGHAFAAAVNISNASFLTEMVPNRLILLFEHSIVFQFFEKRLYLLFYFIFMFCFSDDEER